jgi:hypothetical protein
MKAGDMVNYTGHPFDGPTVGGLILDSMITLSAEQSRGRDVNSHQVYWATHNLTNWVMEKDLEVTA